MGWDGRDERKRWDGREMRWERWDEMRWDGRER
jgi:hypothetical protein